MIDRRQFLRMVGVGAASVVTHCPITRGDETGRSSSRKSNFVFILIDDMGWTDLGFMGNGYYETPRIDQLAAEGVVFKQAYSNAPNCAPTRACLMSGQYTPRHGVYTVGTSERGPARRRKLIPTPNTTTLGADHVTIAETLKAAGYTCACIGKWHLGDKAPYRPQDRGFDVVFDRNRRSHFTDDGQYLTDRLTDESVRFMKACKDKPFFLYLSHHAVHTPIQAKPELTAKYERKVPAGGHDNPKYAAMIESVDQSVGRVLDTLEDLDLARETVVFFFSDNGGYANATSVEPLRGSKGMLYEGGIRVPAIVRWSGLTRPGGICDEPIMGADFYPTMLDMAALAKPGGYTLDGESLLPLLKGTGTLGQRAIFWHFPAYLEPYNDAQWPWRTTPAGAIRQGPWKLIEFFEDGRLELYNLAEDPGETHNLVDELPQKAESLRAKLAEWRRRTKAPVPRQLNPEFDAAALNRA